MNVDVILPAVWQVESDAPIYVLPKAHISYGAEADVEKGDDAHPQIQNWDETLRPLHLVLQGKNLQTHRHNQTVNRTMDQNELTTYESSSPSTCEQHSRCLKKQNVMSSGCDVLIPANGCYNEG